MPDRSTGPRCGNNPHAQLTPGDRQALADFRTFLEGRAARTNTPDRVNDDGSRTITMKRCCNGCGQYVGDVDGRDADEHGNLTDVRAECDHCRPLVEAEAEGCKTWHVTERTIARVADQIDRLRPWVYTKGYWQDVDGKLRVVGLRVGTGESCVVALSGDWLIRHLDGRYAVHKAPTAAEHDGAQP